ncbi:peptide ABC transporter substrate-binding protein [Phytoactinopolyspora halotolerans]|uniref:Peptide ABC transporter substrate-binding protein n=1 Tax=Phytoactinopolyspora halotolerans TaxID=1981512 RepID=A0A6L9SDV0_9ACTN|nr:peptide ABC transporter substrate-binding protein [Phytoactinopolyspora halotolerans]NEE02240.1 peptide ABC transporter substrate-binding protein [Phytoactinopolyspora halotolerans]
MNQAHPIRRRTFLAASLAALGATTTACGFDGDSGSSGNSGEGSGSDAGDSGDGNGDDGAPQQGGTLRVSMIPVPEIDPAIAGGSSNGQIIMTALWEGLVVLDADDPSNVLPGVAESWDVSDDQLVYTFHLRSDAKWSNGDPVTAQDFLWNWQRILTPGIAGENNPSYNQGNLRVVGAGDYMNGETESFDDVGVKALDDATFEITLEAPNPTLLLHLAHYQFFPLHPPTLEELGNDGWLTGDQWVSNGPFVLDRFQINQRAVLSRNEHYWDADNYYLDGIDVTFNDGGTTSDLLSYQSGEIDVTGRIEDDLEAVTTSDVADELMSAPPNQMRQLIMLNSRNTVLNDVRIREALSIAIDRETLGEISKPAVPGNSMVPDVIEGSDQIPGVEYDVDRALTLLDEAGFPNGEGLPTITLMDYQSTPWVEAIGQMWRDNLGIDVTIDNIERGLFIERIEQLMPEDYVGFYQLNTSVSPPVLQSAAQRILPAASSRIGGINLVPPDVAEEFLAAVDSGAPPNEFLAILDGNRYPECERAVELAKQAMAEPDEDKQFELLVECAVARDEAFVEIPVLWGGYNLLIKPHVKNLKLWPFTSVFSTKGVYLEN